MMTGAFLTFTIYTVGRIDFLRLFLACIVPFAPQVPFKSIIGPPCVIDYAFSIA